MANPKSNPLALIIEDDHKLGAIFAQALRVAEFTTKTIHDGQAALDWLRTAVPTLVVLDLHVPRVSGKAILEYIRSDERLAETRIILATADPIIADTLRYEADLVLIKPISFGQLRDMAARLRPS